MNSLYGRLREFEKKHKEWHGYDAVCADSNCIIQTKINLLKGIIVDVEAYIAEFKKEKSFAWYSHVEKICACYEEPEEPNWEACVFGVLEILLGSEENIQVLR